MSSEPPDFFDPAASVRSRPLRVLIVEDEPDHVLVARHLLRAIYGTGFTLDHVATAAAALSPLCGDAHDVALLDYRLADGSGLELLRRAQAEGGRLPIILLTGLGDRGTDVAALRSGAADYLVKGEISVETLERAIRYAIERRRAQEALRQLRGEIDIRIAALTRIEGDLRARMAEIASLAAVAEADVPAGALRERLRRLASASAEISRLIDNALALASEHDAIPPAAG